MFRTKVEQQIEPCILYLIVFSFPENLGFYETVWKNIG